MATLAERLSDFATRLGTEIKAIKLRLFPAGGSTGQRIRKSSGTDYAYAWADDVAIIPFVINGNGGAILAGEKGCLEINFPCEILGWSILGDQTGSIVIDIWKDTYANYPPNIADTITASAKPTVTAAIKNQSSSIPGWITTITAFDILKYKVDSASGFESVTISLRVRKL